jgi:hypothetical protein
MPKIRVTVQMTDVEGHIVYYTGGEVLANQEVTVRLEDGAEIRGNVHKVGRVDPRGESLGRDWGRYGAIELEVDDSQGHLLTRPAKKRVPLYVRLPDGAQIRGHSVR